MRQNTRPEQPWVYFSPKSRLIVRIQEAMAFIPGERVGRKAVGRPAGWRKGALEPHHEAWLAAHPERSVSWLKKMLREGFDVHHLDCDHGNNDHKNLVLIEHTDHMRLHSGGRTLGRMRLWNNRRPPREKIEMTEMIEVTSEIVVRPRKKKPAAAVPKPDDTSSKDAYELSQSGGIWIEIGRQFGVSRSAIRKAAHDYANASGLPWPPIVVGVSP